jgi:hypothetical protein
MKDGKKQAFKFTLSSVSLTLVLLGGCGVLESAQYRPGDLKNDYENPQTGVPLVGTQLPTGPSIKIKNRDLTFDTGLTSCVGADFSEKNQWIFKPIKYSRTLQDFVGGSEISNVSHFTEAFDLVLREIVEPTEGLVTYGKIRDGQSLSALWNRLRDALAKLALPEMKSDSEKKTFWLNVYNFLMIDILRTNPSALVSNQRSGTFSKTRHTVAGRSVTLDQIEYGVLRLGGRKISHSFPQESVPSSIDNRLHVALVCGAKGCPKLRNFAYEAEKLDIILSENVHMFMNDQVKHVAYDAKSQTTRISELFQWFSIDFDSFAGGKKPSDVKQYILRGCRNDKEKLDEFFESIETFSKLSPAQRIPYDWTPNENISI